MFATIVEEACPIKEGAKRQSNLHADYACHGNTLACRAYEQKLRDATLIKANLQPNNDSKLGEEISKIS